MPTGSAPARSLQGLRATRAFIDLDAVAGNVRAVRRLLAPTTRLMAVVKADGYGHGATQVAAAALDAGAELLGVATVGEGAALRAVGIEAQIVLLGSIECGEVAEAARMRLDVTVAEEELLEALRDTVRRLPSIEPVRIHLKVDTGLRRYGSILESALPLAKRIAADPYLTFAGVCTHFASADEPDEPFTDAQFDRFQGFLGELESSGLKVPERHVANSAAIFTGRGTDVEIARLGIGLYGIAPSDSVELPSGMRPVMRIESRVARVFPIEPDDTIGYNRTFRAERPMRGALVPIGYADGYRRSFSNNAWVLLGGQRARVLGRVSMDQIVVGVPEEVDARVGDRVCMLGGSPPEEAPTATELATLASTNAYEILVGIRNRVPRVFVKDGDIVGVRNGITLTG